MNTGFNITDTAKVETSKTIETDKVFIDGKTIKLEGCNGITVGFTKGATGVLLVTNLVTGRVTQFEASNGLAPMDATNNSIDVLEPHQIDATNATGVYVATMGCRIPLTNEETTQETQEIAQRIFDAINKTDLVLKLNMNLGNDYQKPTDQELENYTKDVGDYDGLFRQKRDAYYQTQNNYLISKVVGNNSINTINDISCQPEDIGIINSKTGFLDIPYIYGAKVSAYGYPYDVTYLPEVPTTNDLPATGIAGDIVRVIDSGWYHWSTQTNGWERDIPIQEPINGNNIELEDINGDIRGKRDAFIKALNEFTLSTTPFNWANDYLPNFQINTYKS